MAQSADRPDGRKKMTIYLPPQLIEKLKIAAMQDELHSYEIVEEAVQSHLNEREERNK